jgi:hypothetical protein
LHGLLRVGLIRVTGMIRNVLALATAGRRSITTTRLPCLPMGSSSIAMRALRLEQALGKR